MTASILALQKYQDITRFQSAWAAAGESELASKYKGMIMPLKSKLFDDL
jgi:hypothetical protein